MTAFHAPPVAERTELSCDVLVIGGGTAGTMAALTAAEGGANVLLLEKAHVRHSGALAMGMDGVNNAVIRFSIGRAGITTGLLRTSLLLRVKLLR